MPPGILLRLAELQNAREASDPLLSSPDHAELLQSTVMVTMSAIRAHLSDPRQLAVACLLFASYSCLRLCHTVTFGAPKSRARDHRIPCEIPKMLKTQDVGIGITPPLPESATKWLTEPFQ